MPLVHKHDWAATNSGYRCTKDTCDASFTNADVTANPAPSGSNTPADHVGKKKGF